MSGLMSQGAILTASRFSNFAILVLSPLLLVRILDIEAYGRYQEFMLYATLLVAVCGFGIDASLTYFLPRHPDKDRVYVSQNTILVLAFSAACMAVLILARQPIQTITSFDFVWQLAAYVFLFVNLNWVEYYWIIRKRTDLVLYYSAGRLIIRMSVLLLVAYLTHDIETILWSLVGVEAVRITLVGAYLVKAKLLFVPPEWNRTLDQLRFSMPVGTSALLQQASRSVGKLFIGSILGPAALALYAVASYLLPMVLVIRGSIADVVFPELVRVGRDPGEAIRLWQRSNVVFCALLFPPFIIINYYAEFIVVTLFTSEYLAAVPIFQVYSFWLIRRCFNMDVLLRSRGRTGFMLTGTAASAALNFVLMVVFYQWLGLLGPAIAYILAESLLELYYAFLVKREFALSLQSLVDWRGVWRIAAGCLLGIPVLLAAELLPVPELVQASFASVVFVGICWAVSYRLGVSDIGRIVAFVASQLRLRRQES